jgi:hypothetical protein
MDEKKPGRCVTHFEAANGDALCDSNSSVRTKEQNLVTCKTCTRRLRILNRSAPPPRWHCRETRIVGVSCANDDGTDRQRIIRNCRAGEELTLMREPQNPVHINAVRVQRRNGEQLGYLDRFVADDTAPDLDQGAHVRCRIVAITGMDKTTFGVDIQLARWTGDSAPEHEPWPSAEGLSTEDTGETHSGNNLVIIIGIMATLSLVIWVIVDLLREG